jgi:transcriptional regulator with XRE-family HTH domain
MISDKEKQLLNSLDNEEYRAALAIEHVNTTLATQIRKMREDRTWSQEDLANFLNKHQETISQWENPDYGRYSITTLKTLASVFDVALIVKFVPFDELVNDMVNLSETRLSPPGFRKVEHARPIMDQVYALLSATDATKADISKVEQAFSAVPQLPYEYVPRKEEGRPRVTA